MKGNLTEQNVTTVPKGYRSYKIAGNDQLIISRKGGPSMEDIKTKPTYAEVRKNQQEFGIASMMAKTLRKSLGEGMSAICETYVSGRLTAQFRNLAKHEPGEIGTRSIFPSKHGHHFSGFEFNPEVPYKTIFGAHYFVKNGSRRGQFILHFPSFIPAEVMQKPEGATNFKISARLVALSDFSYCPKSECYLPKNEEIHGDVGAYESHMLPILKIPLEPMTAHVSLPKVLESHSNAGLFLLLAICFYKYEKGQFYAMSKSSAMQIHQVY